ncbi:MAG: DNA repair protein RadC [Clostridia bacterium]|nr:DNA repair protein RadC [Clostridia bacterium]
MERPYEKFMAFGAERLSDAELLAIIIKAGTKEKAAIELIYELMNHNDYESLGLSFLNEVSTSEIQKIKGLGKIKAIQLKAIAEIAKRMTKPADILRYKIDSPEDAAMLLMEDMRFLKQERLVTILLDSKNTVIKIITNTIGGLNSSVIEAREIFKEPIKCSSAKIIIAHNHPSGNPFPSEKDVQLTKRFYEAGKLFGIELMDHIIIGNGVFASLKKMNKF